MVGEPCVLLPWDTEFFGRTIARATANRLDEGLANAVDEWCAEHKVQCLYFLADSADDRTIRTAEARHFHLVDVRVKLDLDVARRANAPVHRASPIEVREASGGDIAALKAIAERAHRDSRFYYDGRFPESECDRLYATWIEQSCQGFADVVWVAEVDNKPAGYLTCRYLSPRKCGDIGLFAVAEDSRGRGAGSALLDAALSWFERQGAVRVEVVTQGRNAGAQRLYQRSGFQTSLSQLWYHKWCEEPCERGQG